MLAPSVKLADLDSATNVTITLSSGVSPYAVDFDYRYMQAHFGA